MFIKKEELYGITKSSNNVLVYYNKSFGNEIKLKNALLKLKVTSCTGGEVISVLFSNKVIDTICPSSTQHYIYINITDLLISTTTKRCIFTFSGSSNLEFDKDNSSVILNYLPKNIIKSQSYERDVRRAGICRFDLMMGYPSCTHKDMTLREGDLILELNHQYNLYNNSRKSALSSIDYNCGQGWNLNIQQYLVEELYNATTNLDEDNNESIINSSKYISSDENKAKSFIYIDGYGNHHLFDEKYYYKINDIKHYVTLKNIEIEYDGTLYCSINNTKYKVEKEVVSTSSHLVLSSELKGILGIEKIDKDIEEISNLKLNIKNLNNAISDCTVNIQKNYENLIYLALYKKVGQIQKEIQGESVNYSENSLKLQEELQKAKDALSIVSLYSAQESAGTNAMDAFYNNNVNDIIKNPKSNFQYGMDKSAVGLSMAGKRAILDKYIYDETMKRTTEENASETYHLLKSQKLINKNNKSLTDNLQLSDIKAYIKTMLLTSISIDEKNITEFINSKLKIKEKGFCLNDLQCIQIDLQMESLNEENKKLETAKEEYEIELGKLQYNLNLYEKKIPSHIIKRQDGSILGFAKTTHDKVYRLVVISNERGNTFYINYNADDQVESISTNEKIKIHFEYQDNKLISINDSCGNLIKYKYNNDLLYQICYSDETSSTYLYDTNSVLNDVMEPSGYGIRWTLNENYGVNQIREYTAASEINNEGIKKTERLAYVNPIKFRYNNTTTSIFDKYNNYIVYQFDSNGNVVCTYEYNKSEANVSMRNIRVKTYSYVNDKIYYSTSLVPYSEDYLKGSKCIRRINDQEEYEYPSSSESIEYFDSLLLTENWICGDEIVLGEFENETAKNSAEQDNNYAEKKIYVLENCSDIKTKRQLKRSVTNEMIQKINNGHKKDFVISAWAIADSACVIRRKTCYCEKCLQDEIDETFDGFDEEYKRNCDEIQENRRFELRAEIKYVNEDNIDIQYVSFDWMNQGLQYCALPISLDSVSNNDVESITVYFDYSYNTGSAQLIDLTMKEGDWDYSEFNQEGLKIYSENSKSQYISIYEYDSDKKLVKSILVDAPNYELMIAGTQYNGYVTKYEYNYKNALIRTINYDGMVYENVYNDQGVIVKTISYNINEPATKLYKESIFDESGKVIGDVNEFGDKVSEYEFANNSEMVSTIIDKNGNKLSYGYNKARENVLEISASIDGEKNSNVISYNAGICTRMSHNGIDVDYTFDGFGRNTNIDVAGKHYLSNQYLENSKETSLITNYGNGEILNTVSDKKGNTTKVLLNDSVIVENNYDRYDRLVSVKDKEKEIYQEFIYNRNNIVEKRYTGQGVSYVIQNEFDEYDVQNKTSVKIGDTVRTSEYVYDEKLPNPRLKELHLPNHVLQKPNYDGLGRINAIGQHNSSFSFGKDIFYKQIGDHSSNLVASEWFVKNGVRKERLAYLYDEKGNIISIKENNVNIVRYTYDTLSRLVREDNKKLDKTTIFTYDIGGNIISREEYKYSLADVSDLENGNTYNYEYASNGWRDQLLYYNGSVCNNYDNLGNPRIYRGKHLTWSHGRQLDRIGDITYQYNVNGVRIAKIAHGVTTKFYVDGSTIIAQESGNNLMLFTHGIDGLNGFTLNENEYYYKKNIQGDITAIMDANGNEIVRYVYDAWGNHEIYVLTNGEYQKIPEAPNSAYSEIAQLNPYRYRGYYYDVETGLYYLNSRYYDCEVGRFINADDISYVDTNNINGLNLYIYCSNNPVNGYDPTGTADRKKILGWIGVGILTVLSVVALVVGTISTGGILPGVLVGAGIGGLVGIGSSITAQGGFEYADPINVLISGAVSAGLGALGGYFSGAFKLMGEFVGSSIGYSLANMSHITSGITLSQVFGTTAVVQLTTTVAGTASALAGSMLGVYVSSIITNDPLDINGYIKEGVKSELPSWLKKLLEWLFG